MCCGYGPKQATYIVLCKQSILGAGESPVLDMSVLTNPSLSATFKCWLMAEIQAPEDSVSFSDCVNLEMSKFFSVMLPIVKKKEKKNLYCGCSEGGAFGPPPQWSVLWGCSWNDAKHQSLYFCFILCAFFLK